MDGRRCDTCKNGYWNFTENNPLGCQGKQLHTLCIVNINLTNKFLLFVEACSCNPFGITNNMGCDKQTGDCFCKRNVIGRDCDQCIEQHWGLGDSPEGCKPCDCDPGGSLHNDCDMFTGQCK